MKKLAAIILVMVMIAAGAFAQEAKRTVTRADVIEKLSTADFMKKKIGDLLNWSVGYDITKINRTNLAPTISFIKATPVKVPPDNRTLFMITARVSDPSGPDNIKGVRADLSQIQKLPNMMLVDNGLFGDSVANDNIYSLQTSVGNDVQSGSKDIPVAVANKAGWVALGQTNVDVEINPLITEAKAVPQSVPSTTGSSITLSARVVNPGRQEDLKDVTIDLSAIGLENSMKMWDDGTNGDANAGDKIFTLSVHINAGINPGLKKLPVRAVNTSGGSSVNEILLVVE